MDNTDKKILIVDDDETSRSLLRQVLGDCTNIFEAADGVFRLNGRRIVLRIACLNAIQPGKVKISNLVHTLYLCVTTNIRRKN